MAVIAATFHGFDVWEMDFHEIVFWVRQANWFNHGK